MYSDPDGVRRRGYRCQVCGRRLVASMRLSGALLVMWVPWRHANRGWVLMTPGAALPKKAPRLWACLASCFPSEVSPVRQTIVPEPASEVYDPQKLVLVEMLQSEPSNNEL